MIDNGIVKSIARLTVEALSLLRRDLPAMPWRLFVVMASVGGLGGVTFGFVRGLGHLPTLPFAIIEGGILFGVPAAFLGLLLAGAWSLGSAVRHRSC